MMLLQRHLVKSGTSIDACRCCCAAAAGIIPKDAAADDTDGHDVHLAAASARVATGSRRPSLCAVRMQKTKQDTRTLLALPFYVETCVCFGKF